MVFKIRICSVLTALFLRFLLSAQTAAARVSGVLVHVLMMESDIQRYIASSNFYLLVALFIFIVVIMLVVIIVLHRSLVRSLSRENEKTFFSHAYMLAQDEERSRISRELHDTV